MLEHSAMYLNVTPPYEEDASFFTDLYSRIGSCELPDPVWAKMNALTGPKPKRKKSENKPQTQINKCNNEKKRREQENIYVEELAELISANFGDMSSLSVKPDKCAILQETVNQIRRIKQQEVNQQIADPVQQGEVSSSRPTILSNEVYGPLLLEALDGFLFVINSDGKVEHVTDNVTNYLRYTKDEIIGKSIYNFIHLGDHNKFHSNLLPMTIEWGVTRSKSLDVRLLTKPETFPQEPEEVESEKVPCYELMHIASTQLRENLSVSEEDGSDSGPCLLCVANRISQRDKAAIYFKQFATRLDTSGKIICVSGVSDPILHSVLKDCKGLFLQDLVPAEDVQIVTAHLKEVVTSGTSLSSIYRIQVSPDKLLAIKTKSRLFPLNPHGDIASDITSDVIMSTHSIIADNDAVDPGGGIGGPLMSSIANGTGTPSRLSITDGTSPSPSASTGNLMQSSGTFNTEFLDNDFPPNDIQLQLDLELPHFPTPTTTWELEPPSWSDTGRPSSRQSITPVSTPTPRPPSNPSYSNAPTVVHSPMPHYSAHQSPATTQAQQNQTNSPFMFGGMDDFQEQSGFNVEDQKDNTKALEEPVAHQRLRSLLTNPPTSSANSSSSGSNSTVPQQDQNRNPILKELLNQEDDDQNGRIDNRNTRLLSNRGPQPEPPKSSASSSGGNQMLRKLLDEKDGMNKGSELLQQLLKKDSDDDEKKNENPHEDVLLANLGFPTSSSVDRDRRGSKRSSDEKDDRDSKRSNNGSQVSSSGSSEKSEIYRRNQMLASLLENPTPTPPSIPPIPASVISATPQEKLPRVITDPAKLIGGTMSQNNNNVGRHNNANKMANRQPISYLNNNNNFHNRALANVIYNNQSTSTENSIWNENNNIQGLSDPDLSDILDTVLDFVPDASGLHMEPGEGQPTTSSQLSEMAAIKNIQNLLMQCEKAVPSPNVSLPARPPAYNANVSTQSSMAYPPPNYPQNVKYSRAVASVRQGVPPHYVTAGNINPQQLLLEQQRKLQRQAEEQKRRLLQQQKQQQLLIPSNATAAEMNSIQNIDSLMNNTVAPNVTLQRSNSLPQESQLSPNYAGGQLPGPNSLNQNNQRGTLPQPTQTQPYSPHSQMPSPLGQQTFQSQSSAPGGYNQQQRLSPQTQFNTQLSPRQNYPQQVNPGGGGGPGWAQQQTQQRLTAQNPMLNAQLTGSLTGRGNFQRPSPAQQNAQQQRQSPFGGDQFAAPASPTAAYNQTQFLRLQRANSVPNAASQMPGGLGSPRSYAGPNQPPPHYSSNPLQGIPQNPMLYSTQQDYNCYEQQQQQPGLTGYERRASAPSAQQHLQPGVAGGNPTSEFVRQELRAVVGARTAQAQPTGGQRSGPSPAQQLQQQLNQQGTVDLESLGITFEMPSGASDSPKLWGAMGSDMGSMSPPQPATSRTTMEEGRAGDPSKTSLLQQLLSDQSK